MGTSLADIFGAPEPQKQPSLADIFSDTDQRKGRLDASVTRSREMPPDQTAEALTLSRRTGLPVQVVQRRLPDVQRLAGDRTFNPGQFVREYPQTAEWLSDPVNASVAKDDYENLGNMERLIGRGTFLDRFLTAFGQAGQSPSRQSEEPFRRPERVTEGVLGQRVDKGIAMLESGRIGVQRWFSDSPELAREAFALQRLMEAPEADIGNGAARAIAGTAQIAPSIAASGLGATAGAAIGGVLGTFVAPGPGTAGGAAAGGAIGAYLSSFLLEGGNMMNQFSAMKDENGQAMPRNVAIAASVAGGSVSGALDAASTLTMLKPLGEAGQVVLNRGIARALQQATNRQALVNGVKAWGTSVGTEVVTETAQQGVNLLAEQLGRNAANAQGLAFEDIPGGRVTEELATTAVETFYSTLLIGGFGGAVTTMTDLNRVAQARADEDALGQMVGLTEASALRQRDPEKFREALQAQLQAEGGTPYLYADAERVEILLQENSVPLAQFAQAVGVPEVELADALARGGDVRFPTPSVMANLVGTPIFEAMKPDVKLRPDAMSQREAAEVAKTLDADVKATREAMDAIIADGTTNASGQRVIDDLVAKITAATASQPQAKQFTPENIEATARGIAAFYITRAERLGRDAFDYYAERNYRIVSRETAEPAFDLVSIINDKTSTPEAKGKARTDLQALLGTQGTDALTQAPALTPQEIDQYYALEAWRVFEAFPDQTAADVAEVIVAPVSQVKRWLSQPKPELTPEQERSTMLRIAFLAQSTPEERPNAFILPGVSQQTIALMNGTNLSSLMHEFAHDWLVIMGKDAALPDAPQSIKDDYATILKYLGVESAEQIGEREQEFFARSFERYIATAEAPSRGLARAFVRFRSWMARIYRQLEAMFVPVNPAIADVFDRMLASDAEIARVRGQNGTTPFTPEDAQKLGMTPQQAEAYTEKVRLRDANERGQLLAALLAEKSDEARKIRREREAVIRSEVEQEVDARPVYQAIAQVTGDGPKLNREILQSQFGADITRTLPRGATTDEGGIDADALALAYGFRDGFAVVEAMQTAPTRKAEVNRIVRERMTQEFPDPMQDSAAMQAEAQKVVHRADTDDVLLDELKMLGRSAGIRPPSVQAVKQVARETIARMVVKDIRPVGFQNAEATAARKSTEALRSGNIPKAEFHKRQQLLNHILYREATKALDFVASAEKFARRMQMPSAQATIGKGGKVYAEAMAELLDRYEFRRLSNVATDVQAAQRGAMLKWAEEQQSLDIPIEVDDRILAEAERRNYRTLTFADLQSVSDAMRQIYHTASGENRLLAQQKRADFEETKARVLASIAEHNTGKRDPINLDESTIERLLEGVNAAHGSLVKPQMILRLLDGDKAGPLTEALWYPYRDAVAEEGAMMKDASGRLTQAMNKISKARRKAFFDAALQVEGVNAGPGAPLGKMTGWDVFWLALNWGNEGNRTAILESSYNGTQPWTVANVERLLGLLTAEELLVVQEIWDLVDSYWPQVAELQRQMTGITPAKVEAEPLLILSADGKPVSLKGGYYPLKYDAKYSPKAWSQKQAELEGIRSGASATGPRYVAATKHGHTKERVGSDKRPVMLDGSVLSQHLVEVIHDLSHRRFVHDAQKLLNDKDIQAAIEGAMGRGVFRRGLLPWVRRVAGEQTAPLNFIEKMFNHARAGTTVVGMGLRFSTAWIQFSGYIPALDFVGPVHLAQALKDYAASPRKMQEDALEMSAVLRQRRENFDRDIRDRTRGETPLAPKSAAWFYFTSLADMQVSVPVWWAGYYREIQASGDTQKAIRAGDDAVLMSQGGGAPGDLSAIQAGGPLTRAFTLFYSYASALYSMFWRSTRNTAEGRFSKARFIGSLAAIWFIPVVVETLMMPNRGPDEDDSLEDKAEWWAWKLLTYPATIIPGLRDIVNAADPDGYGYKLTPVSRAFESVAAFGKAGVEAAVEDEPLTRSDAKALVEAIGYWGQLPTGQFWTTSTAMYDWMMGYDSPEAAMQAPEFLLFPRPR